MRLSREFLPRSCAAIGSAALLLGLLTGCSAGPDPDAVAAAEAYAEELTEWAEGLDDTGDAEQAIAASPELDAVEGAENTPTYLEAERVAGQISSIEEELLGLRAESLAELASAADESYWVVADLYYETLGAAADRLNAITASWDIEDDAAAGEAVLDAHHSFLSERVTLLETAIEEFPAVAPSEGLGASVAAFAVDWFEEELDFDQRALEQIEASTVFPNGYKDFWNFGNLNEVLRTPEAYGDELRIGYAAQALELAELLSERITDTSAEAEPLELPGLAEPYRQALIEGYRPWGDAEADQEFTTARLWMLWRIRELEKTPDEAYTAARTALLEELNRGLAEDETGDFRPGATRLLDLIARYSDQYDLLFDVDRYWLDGLAEVLDYGHMLREDPMTSEVADAFDEVLALYEELNGKLEKAATGDPDDAYSTASDLGEEYADRIVDAATPVLEVLDDDAQYEALLAERLAATAPSS